MDHGSHGGAEVHLRRHTYHGLMINLPTPLIPVLEAVRRVGRPRLVGGCVRDALLGIPAGDWDVEVSGTDFDRLQSVLAHFGGTDVVGRSFGTIKLRRHGVVYDFSLPRRESKVGAGHRGFKITPEPSLTDAEAAARRDFTINAIAWDPFSNQLIDPHDGQDDLRRKVLRHTSDAFAEDPLRVLRGMQFAARFDLQVAPETRALCRSISNQFAELPRERIWGEWDKWATRSTLPSRGLALLHQCDWLQHFPQIAALAATPQDPEWHPEGDVLIHTSHCLDALIEDRAWKEADDETRRVLSFAVLLHDAGKPATTEQTLKHGKLRWASPGHANAGLEPANDFLSLIGAPNRLFECVAPLVKFHMVHIDAGSAPFTDSFVRRLARKLAPVTVSHLSTIMRADARGRPPLDPQAALRTINALSERAQDLALTDAAPQPILLGRHLVKQGMQPGPAFAPLLHAAFEAQLAGVFSDEAGSLKWLDDYLNEAPK